MRRLALLVLGAASFAVFVAASRDVSAQATGKTDPRLEGYKPANDPFEARRLYDEATERLKREQEAKRATTVPTFTIPQPGVGKYGHHWGRHHHGRRYGPRVRGRLVFVPGHWEFWAGGMVYVPPHYVYAPY